MGFSDTRQDITATVKEQTDIVKIIGEHVELKRSGVRYLGLCPFHGEKTPSFSVHGDQQFYYCFGCAESGDVFSFLMKYHNYDFPEALKFLADRLNIELPKKNVSWQEKEKELKRNQMYAVTEKAAKIYRKYLLDEKKGAAAREYLRERDIPEDIQARFGLGYAPAKEQVGWDFLARQLSAEETKTAIEVGLLVKKDRGGQYDKFRDRILFPIYDTRGRVCGFGGRIVGQDQPKYMNSPESPIFNKSRNLLGLYQQADEIRKTRKAVIVEGNFDMISLVQHGCGHVAAPLGTALTSAQIRLLAKYADEAILLFDGDEAGVKAAMRAAPLFLAEQMVARVALLPEGEDPDTYVRKFGLEKLNELLDSSAELAEFVLDQLINTHGLTLEGKSKIAEEVRPLVAAAVSPLQRSVVAAHFAEKLGVGADQLEAAVDSKNNQGAVPQTAGLRKRQKEQATQPLSPAQRRLVEFMILYIEFFNELEAKNIRKVLQGGIGEIVYLQIRKMLKEADETQPEEILQALPDGPERKLVADILINASQKPGATEVKEELQEVLGWLDLQGLRQRSHDLSVEIDKAQQEDDFTALGLLLQEKQKIDAEMQRFR
jgi:DNA primase